MRTHSVALKIVSGVTLVLFSWTYLPLYGAVAFAAIESGGNAKGQKEGTNRQERAKTTEEKFQGALDRVREAGSDRGKLKAERSELEMLDLELQKQFKEAEAKIRDLPEVIKQRHRDFVKKYSGNMNTLKSHLDSIEGAKTEDEAMVAAGKAKAFLVKTKAPSRHQKLDPNNLPFRTIKAKEWAPRLKKEEFEKDFPPQRHQGTKTAFATGEYPRFDHSGTDLWARIFNSELKCNSIQLAYNDIASDVPLALGTGQISASPSHPVIASKFELIAMSEPLMLAQAVQDLPTAADLSETPEVQFTPEIKAKAQELGNNPVKIYEWVRNNIEFVPTYGSIQGADMCLQTQQCNAFDTASLLTALLRASGISARYAYGTIEVPIEKVMNWVGGFTDPMAAATLMASGGIPVKPIIAGSKIAKVQMEHVWVEAFIPYGNYRGAIMDQSIKTWIPMDGSYKEYVYTPGFDITPAVSFHQNEYLGQIQSQNPVHYYQSRIQEYLDINQPETTIIDVKGYREIKQEKYPFLASTLPYKTVVKGAVFAGVPADARAKAIFSLPGASLAVATPEVAGKRLTLSYIPATSSDEALINSYGGYLYSVPAYLLSLKPVLRIDGTIKLTGEAVTMGDEQVLTFELSQPKGPAETVQKNLIAGAYYAIGLDLQGMNENVLGKRNYTLTTNVFSETAGTLGKDDLIGELLYLRAVTYFLANDKIYKSGAKLYNIAVTRSLSEGITSFTLSVAYLFSIPRTVSPTGVEIDVAMDRLVAIARDGNLGKEKAFMEIAGLTSSYHEHDIFERIDGYSSVSTVRALQAASAKGIPIYQVNGTNITQMLSELQVGPEIKQDIQNAVNAGREVTISRTNVQVNDWQGVGYIVRDPSTGSGTYRITGGLAGGSSTNKADGMRVVALNNEPLGQIKDRIDPQTRGIIITAAEMNVGELILGVAEDTAGMGYTDIGQCVGLLRVAYWSAGICLDMWSPWAPSNGTGSCGSSNLVQKHHISGTNGVSYFYNLADHLNISINNGVSSGIRKTNEALVGDMIFWDNTWDKNGNCEGDDELTHVGIVKWAPDEYGTLLFIHASSKGVVTDKLMNITDSSNAGLNTQIRNSWKTDNPCTQNQWNSVDRLAGQLFVGFGTVRDVSCANSTHK